MSPTPGKPRPVRGASTRAVHGSKPHAFGPLSTPIVHSATFSFPSLAAMNAEQAKGPAGAYYQRVGHPTMRACEERLAAIEGAEGALLFSSGVAATSAMLLSVLKPGDHAITLHQSYGGTHDLLKFGCERFGWSCTFVDAREPDTFAAAFRPETKLFHVESPTNPITAIVDLAAAAKLAHARGALLSVDNTFASPVGQQPLALGADLVVYSATKSIGGHGDLMAGAVTGASSRLAEVWHMRKLFGPVLEPATAWQIERSLKTLPLRVSRQNGTALELAGRLERHPGVARVFYPGLAAHPGHAIAARQMGLGFGPIVAFEVRGGAAAAEETANALQLVLHAPSLGGVESLVSLPAFTSQIQLGPEGRAKAGIPEGTVRLSVGIEDVEDLWADLDQAIVRAAALKV